MKEFLRPNSKFNENRTQNSHLVPFEDFFGSEKFFSLFGFPLLHRVEESDKYKKAFFIINQILYIFLAIPLGISIVVYAIEKNFQYFVENGTMLFMLVDFNSPAFMTFIFTND